MTPRASHAMTALAALLLSGPALAQTADGLVVAKAKAAEDVAVKNLKDAFGRNS